METLGFEAVIATVDEALQPFVTNLHRQLTESGCTLEVKEAKSGYVVSYLYHKKVLVNYVFRKKGMFARIYGAHIMMYPEILDTLPPQLVAEIQNAPVCKRLMNPDACNSRCPMGYDFILHGERQQKCRNSAFYFLLCQENNPVIEAFLKKELEARALVG